MSSAWNINVDLTTTFLSCFLCTFLIPKVFFVVWWWWFGWWWFYVRISFMIHICFLLAPCSHSYCAMNKLCSFFLLYIAYIKIQCSSSLSLCTYKKHTCFSVDSYTDIYVFEWMSHYAENVARVFHLLFYSTRINVEYQQQMLRILETQWDLEIFMSEC